MLGANWPTYSFLVKNMKVAEAAVAELPHLEGEKLLQQQQQCVQDLLVIANQEQVQYAPPQCLAGSDSELPPLQMANRHPAEGPRQMQQAPSLHGDHHHRSRLQGSQSKSNHDPSAVNNRVNEPACVARRQPARQPPPTR